MALNTVELNMFLLVKKNAGNQMNTNNGTLIFLKKELHEPQRKQMELDVHKAKK
jgi:hypothetical protein